MKQFPVKTFLGLLLLAGLISVGNVQAATLHVDDDAACPGTGTATGPYCKIQDAINASADGDEVLVHDGTYHELLTFNGSKTITVRSVNGPDKTIINGDTDYDGIGDGSIVTFTNDSSNLEGFTITKGNALNGGGIICIKSSPTIVGCIIKNNICSDYGGGIYLDSSFSTISECTINNNTSSAGGGVCSVNGGKSYLKNCEINYNSCSTNGAVYISSGSIIIATDSTISNNSGKGFHYIEKSQGNVYRCTIENNSSHGIFNNNSLIGIKDCKINSNGNIGLAILNKDWIPYETITGCTINGNSGDGIFLSNIFSSEIINCTLSNNFGRGIRVEKAFKLLVDSCTVNGNMISGINFSPTVHFEGNVKITDCTVSENSAPNGGGIDCNFSTISVVKSNIINNSASFNGGGIHCYYSTPFLINSNITGNNAGSKGGGIFCNYSSPTITNCTVSYNVASNNGGGIYCPDLPLTPIIVNNILWGNSASSGGEQIFAYSAYGASVNYSNIQGGWGTQEEMKANHNIDTDPLFVDPTNDNFHLQINSPCIDMGTSDTEIYSNLPADDIDGDSRYTGLSYDMGADENLDIPECIDNDNDGFYTHEFCSSDVDCDDSRPYINPGMDEVCGNKIDDNCDGIIDEEGCEEPHQIIVPDDYITIQQAIDAALHSNLIIVKDGIYTENINFKGKAITVKSEKGPETTIIDGNANGSVVTFNSGEDKLSILDGFTITGGSGTDQNGSGSTYGGGIYCDSSSPTITNCIVEGNSVLGSGGGIYCYLYSWPIISNCIINNNSAPNNNGGGVYSCHTSHTPEPSITNCTVSNNSGGGIRCDSSSPKIDNCTISGNTDAQDGGIFIYYDSAPTITNCTIDENSGYGITCNRDKRPIITNCIISNNAVGGIYAYDSGAIFTACTITNNSSSGEGGGIFIKGLFYGEINNCTITGNFGNGIYSYYSHSRISGCTINNNTGNGIYCDGRPGYPRQPMITNCNIYENAKSGIYSYTSNPVISQCTIKDNGEDGIFCTGPAMISPTITHCNIDGNAGNGIKTSDYAGSAEITNCSITNNSGRGIHCGEYFTQEIDNCTISGNAGGIYCFYYSSPTITNCLITNNTAVEDGGGISSHGASPNINSCKIIGNKAVGNGGGISLNQDSDFDSFNYQLTNCIIGENSAGGDGGGIYVTDHLFNSPPIFNCTISRNSANNNGGGAFIDSYFPIKIVNSILWENKTGEVYNEIFLAEKTSITITYSDIQGGWEGKGNIDNDPLFVDPDNGDYYMKPGSPCIDTGTSDTTTYPSLPADDIDGYFRPRGAGYDMGAYEYRLPIFIVDIDLNMEPIEICFTPNQLLDANPIVTFKLGNGTLKTLDGTPIPLQGVGVEIPPSDNPCSDIPDLIYCVNYSNETNGEEVTLQIEEGNPPVFADNPGFEVAHFKVDFDHERASSFCIYDGEDGGGSLLDDNCGVDNDVDVDFKAGDLTNLSSGCNVVTIVAIDPASTPAPPNSGMILMYDIKLPDGVEVADGKTVTVTLAFELANGSTRADYDSGAKTFAILYYDEATESWKSDGIAFNYDTDIQWNSDNVSGTATFETSHFTVFSLLSKSNSSGNVGDSDTQSSSGGGCSLAINNANISIGSFSANALLFLLPLIIFRNRRKKF